MICHGKQMVCSWKARGPNTRIRVFRDNGWFGPNNCLIFFHQFDPGGHQIDTMLKIVGFKQWGISHKEKQKWRFPSKIESCQSCVYRSADIKSIGGVDWVSFSRQTLNNILFICKIFYAKQIYPHPQYQVSGIPGLVWPLMS